MEDGRVGPQLSGSFDFTLTFEHAVLGIPISALFVIAAAVKITWLRRNSVTIPVRSKWIFWSKTVI